MIKNWIIYLVAEKLRELELFGLEKVRGDCVNVYESLMVWNREEGDRHFSVLSSDNRKNNRHTLKCKKFHSNIRKTLVHMWVLKHWHRLPSKVLECLAVDLLKT